MVESCYENKQAVIYTKQINNIFVETFCLVLIRTVEVWNLIFVNTHVLLLAPTLARNYKFLVCWIHF